MDDVLVVDTSLAFKWLVQEEDSDRARALRLRWDTSAIQLAAPHLLLAELSNAVHRMVVEDNFAVQDAVMLISQVSELRLDLFHSFPLYPRALELASALQQGAAYDCVFLALAESLDCELWTADGRFYRVTRDHHPRVHWLGEVAALS